MSPLLLSDAEQKFLRELTWGVHVSCVYHRPELWSLIKKGLVTLEDQQRVPAKNKPSFYPVLTPEGKDAKKVIEHAERNDENSQRG